MGQDLGCEEGVQLDLIDEEAKGLAKDASQTTSMEFVLTGNAEDIIGEGCASMGTLK